MKFEICLWHAGFLVYYERPYYNIPDIVTFRRVGRHLCVWGVWILSPSLIFRFDFAPVLKVKYFWIFLFLPSRFFTCTYCITSTNNACMRIVCLFVKDNRGRFTKEEVSSWKISKRWYSLSKYKIICAIPIVLVKQNV